MSERRPTALLSWVARNNDPFERERDGIQFARDGAGRIWGPTLTLLADPESPWYRKIDRALLLHGDDERSRDVFEMTQRELRNRLPKMTVQALPCAAVSDPTDHKALFEWLQAELPRWRQPFDGHHWVIHLSPGTPAMQTAWLLLAETSWPGERPTLVKTYRKRDRPDGPRVVTVDFALDTILGTHRATRLVRPVPPEETFRLPLEKARSERLRGVLKRAKRFAALSVPILLLGERGTGKTTTASMIRAASPFQAAGKEWPTVACGQFSGELIRAELFGHAKGAFTGAVQERQGLLEMLDGDTLFLDEVGDIDGDTQRMLVRALEEQQFQRLGEGQDRRSRFRLVTATNRSLAELADRLDADFFDRIAAFRVTLPPLREIPEDLSWLWREVYQSALDRSEARQSSCQLGDRVHDRIVETLRQHHLPGNVRDLLRVAWHLQAALSDDADVAEAVDFAIDALEQPSLPARRGLDRAYAQGEAVAAEIVEPLDPARRLALAFARDSGLRQLVKRDGRLQWRQFEQQFKGWLAREVKMLPRARGESVEDLIDVTGRALNDWLQREAHGNDGSD